MRCYLCVLYITQVTRYEMLSMCIIYNAGDLVWDVIYVYYNAGDSVWDVIYVYYSVESVYKNCERLNEACYTKLRRLIANHYTIMYTEPDWKYLPPPPLPAEDRRR